MTYPYKPGFKARHTAKLAARSMYAKAPSLRDRIFEALRRAGPDGLTPDECADALRVSPLSIRPRFSELALMGAIEDTMRRRRNATSGRFAVVWRVK